MENMNIETKKRCKQNLDGYPKYFFFLLYFTTRLPDLFLNDRNIEIDFEDLFVILQFFFFFFFFQIPHSPSQENCIFFVKLFTLVHIELFIYFLINTIFVRSFFLFFKLNLSNQQATSCNINLPSQLIKRQQCFLKQLQMLHVTCNIKQLQNKIGSLQHKLFFSRLNIVKLQQRQLIYCKTPKLAKPIIILVEKNLQLLKIS
eukprot:TRINITY_DN3028_c0_g1_i2.p4 TRINITY_DN3028_c0_g1~~TRINITY_DN3028_c0_g1_i2.p4  ORF type:complete len:202 (-),score=2.86 TRINITY_DN3028_c0_g1_i2:302-907(-)